VLDELRRLQVRRLAEDKPRACEPLDDVDFMISADHPMLISVRQDDLAVGPIGRRQLNLRALLLQECEYRCTLHLHTVRDYQEAEDDKKMKHTGRTPHTLVAFRWLSSHLGTTQRHEVYLYLNTPPLHLNILAYFVVEVVVERQI